MPTISDALSAAQLDAFIADGFVRLDGAFPTAIADEGRALLWRATGCDPDDPSSWTKPVIRIGQLGLPPFVAAANTPLLHRAFDQLVGTGRWLPRNTLGTFPIRFPSSTDPGDAGWHVDASFGEDNPDFMEWRVNVTSRGRALLMLFLFSDVGEEDAPTRIRVGSHFEIARRLQAAGDAGMTLRQLAADRFDESSGLPEILATGAPGTVYLCHPFLVHAAQMHTGKQVKFMAQPPLQPSVPLALTRSDGEYSPVEIAIRRAIGSDQ